MNEGNSALMIKRRDGAGGYDDAVHGDFVADIVSAARMGHDVWTWAGESRRGGPITVVWVAGRFSGRLLEVFELPA